MNENQIGTIIIGAAVEVHKSLGPGLLESSYHHCLVYALQNKGLMVESEVPLALKFNEVNLGCCYRIDLIINKKVIIEIKSVESLNKVHLAQMLTYLKLSRLKLGYLLNFNQITLKEGIKRVIL
jgi:GxxExxY protein